MDVLKKLLMIASVAVMAFSSAWTAIAAHDEPVKIEGEGSILLGDDSTIGQAKAAALNNARRAALEKATGVEVRGSSTVYNYQLINDLVLTATRGIIVKENVINNSCTTKDEQVSCNAKVEVWVKPLHTERRGNFKVTSAGVHRPDRQEEVKSPVFQSGDAIHIHAAVNQDAYLSLFSVDQYGGISRIFPNDYVKAEKLPAAKELVFPDDAMMRGGLKLVVRTPKGKKKAVESVMVIATKENVPLLADMKSQDLTITDLMRELSGIDPSLWVEHTVGYEVRE